MTMLDVEGRIKPLVERLRQAAQEGREIITEWNHDPHLYDDSADNSLILKMDIEGAEWSVFDNLSPALLRRFRQIVGEFHCFTVITTDAAWRRRAERVFGLLSLSHAVVHIHGNNCGPMTAIGVPDALEITFASRDVYRFRPCTESFPTPLDRRNTWGLPDVSLDYFNSRQAN